MSVITRVSQPPSELDQRKALHDMVGHTMSHLPAAEVIIVQYVVHHFILSLYMLIHTYMTGGGAPRPCTTTAGILADFGIDRLVAAGNKPTLDTTTETYYFNDVVSLNLNLLKSSY